MISFLDFFSLIYSWFVLCVLFFSKVLGDVENFENAVRLVIRDVSFDNDVVVSVFETNIRVLG